MKRATVIAIAIAAAPLPALGQQDLMAIYNQARQNAPQLNSARAATRAADARYRQARGELLPQVSGNASFSKVKSQTRFKGGGALPSSGQAGGGQGGGSGGGGRGGSSDSDDEAEFRDQQSLTLDLEQALFDWSAWQAKDAAALRTERAERKRSAAAGNLIVRTARSYFDVLAARAAREAAERQTKVIKKQLDRAKAAYESGLAPITDLQQARSQLDSVRVDAIDATNQLANSRDALSRLTGAQHPDLASASAPFKVSPPAADRADQWIQRALKNNPQLAAGQKALAAARQDIGQARGGHLPTVDLTGSIGESERIVDFGTGNSTQVTETTSVGIQVSLPIFAGGSIAASVDEARASAAQTRQDLIETRRQVKVDTRTAFRDLHASTKRVQALNKAIESGETAVEAARAGLNNGTRNILDVLEAEIELIQRRVDRKQAWYDYVVAGLRLKQQTGQLSEQDLKRVNTRLDAAAADTPN